jgi:hypothetical protein
MLDLEDLRWRELKGGYRTPYDPRPALTKLELGTDVEEAWYELWEELHHQGDVGEAAYAVVPHLVRIYLKRGGTAWNTYAMVATIELARGESDDPLRNKRKNPELPEWLKEGYFKAIRDLAEAGINELSSVQNPYDLRGILSVVALYKGARSYARMLLEYSEEEVIDMESSASEIACLKSKADLQQVLKSVAKK